MSRHERARKPAHARPAYRKGVGIMLLNGENRVFVARRIDMPSAAWQMPQGGIDAGETPLEAAWREMLEEVGTDRADLLAESRKWLRYDLPPDLASQLWRGRFRGQQQKWFAFRFTGTDSDIDIEHHDHPEFSDWRWVEMVELPGLIVPFKRQLYADIVAEFEGLVRR